MTEAVNLREARCAVLYSWIGRRRLEVAECASWSACCKKRNSAVGMGGWVALLSHAVALDVCPPAHSLECPFIQDPRISSISSRESSLFPLWDEFFRLHRTARNPQPVLPPSPLPRLSPTPTPTPTPTPQTCIIQSTIGPRRLSSS